jgi:DNA polymerase III epsilon subunit-like protein
VARLGGYIVAHNARFDQRVLHASLASTRTLDATWLCTLELVKALFPKPAWEKHTLSYASEQLQIQLSHHDPLSDARAAAIIASRILGSGVDWTPYKRTVTRPNVKAARAG